MHARYALSLDQALETLTRAVKSAKASGVGIDPTGDRDSIAPMPRDYED